MTKNIPNVFLFMHGLWDITVSRDEVEGFEKLKAISQIAPIKERIRFFESKYGCTLGEFKDRIKREKEDFESGWTTSSGEHTLKA